MKLSIDSDLVVEGVHMDALRISPLIQAVGPDRSEEKIPLHGGGIRKRETWGATGATTLRDDEEEVLFLIVDASQCEVSVGGRELPTTERDFLRLFASAEKQIGHSYSLGVKQWLLHFDFPRIGRGVVWARPFVSFLASPLATRRRANQAISTTRGAVRRRTICPHSTLSPRAPRAADLDVRQRDETMSHYQKIIICAVRLIGAGLVLYPIPGVLMAFVMHRAMWKISLIGAVPTMFIGLVLFLIAAPLAKAITWGIRD